MQRYCMIFYCDKRGERFCCADCHLRRDCANPCLNHPSRCRLEDPYGKPIRRRGGAGKIYYKERKWKP